ncbi:MAG: hypothetical protein ACI3W7_08375 [Oscillospiraceae bacterium]
MFDLKRKVGTVTGAAVRKARRLVSSATGKKTHVRRIARLNVEISAERDGIKRAYAEIGKLYYETHREAPDDYFIRLCQDIDRSMAAISSMEAEIMQLKTGQNSSPTAKTAAESEE